MIIKPAAKLTIKPTSNPGAKSERIPKVSKSSVAAKSKPGPKKTVVPQAKKPRNDREERLRTGHEMAAEFEAHDAGENAGLTVHAPERGQTSQPPSDEEEDGPGNESYATEEEDTEQNHEEEVAPDTDLSNSSLESVQPEVDDEAVEAARIQEAAAKANELAKKMKKEARRAKRLVREAKEKAMLRSKKREEKERKDKAARDSLHEALENDIFIVSSEDSTDTAFLAEKSPK